MSGGCAVLSVRIIFLLLFRFCSLVAVIAATEAGLAPISERRNKAVDSQLKQKERLFCLYMAQAFTPAEAAFKAGYIVSPRKAAEKLLCRRDIADGITASAERLCRISAAAGYSRIAFGGVADAVRLCFSEELPEDVDTLDLYAVSELKRSKNGVEIKLYDRIDALDRLKELTQANSEKAEPFYRAIEQGAKQLYGEE